MRPCCGVSQMLESKCAMQPEGVAAMAEGMPRWTVQVPTDASVGLVQYCNAAQVIATEWDISLDFSQLVPFPPQEPGGQPSVARNTVARIIMSPQHAKAFSELLRQNVADYERQHGELPLLPRQANEQTGERGAQ
jgi:hypothetical protein